VLARHKPDIAPIANKAFASEAINKRVPTWAKNNGLIPNRSRTAMSVHPIRQTKTHRLTVTDILGSVDI